MHRNALLDEGTFYTLKAATVLVEQWRILYNAVRPRSSLGYPPSELQAIKPEPIRIVHSGSSQAQCGLGSLTNPGTASRG